MCPALPLLVPLERGVFAAGDVGPPPAEEVRVWAGAEVASVEHPLVQVRREAEQLPPLRRAPALGVDRHPPEVWCHPPLDEHPTSAAEVAVLVGPEEELGGGIVFREQAATDGAGEGDLVVGNAVERLRGVFREPLAERSPVEQEVVDSGARVPDPGHEVKTGPAAC